MASVSNHGLRNDLALNIKSILSHLEEDKVQCLVDFLISKGVKKESDLRRMTVKVLEEHLGDFIDASDLHDEWQKCYGKVLLFISFAPFQSDPMLHLIF